MARDYETALVLRAFTGLDQSKAPELTGYQASPDCVNMDTGNGNLCTAKGYAKLDVPPVPGGAQSLGAFYRRADGKSWLLAANAGGIWACEGGSSGLDFDDWDDDTDAPSEWVQIYAPPAGEDGSPGTMGAHVDFLNYQDNEDDVVLMADGVNPVLTWHGEGMAAAQAGIEQRFAHLETNYERLWGSGAPGEPDTVYWSRQFDVSNWEPDAEDPDNGGGYVMIPTWNGGRVRLIRALFNDIVIFKDSDVYKLTGTYPGEYQVDRVNGDVGPIAARTVVQYGDRVYFLGKTGLCAYNGVQVTDTQDRRWKKWHARISEHYVDAACAIKHNSMMYIALPVDGSKTNNLVIEYDMERDTVMPRTGIRVSHWIEWEDRLIFADPEGRLYEYGVGETYDGGPIEAYWTTPTYSMGSSDSIGDRTTKQLGELTCYGEGRMHVTTEADNKIKQTELFFTTPFKRMRKRLNVRGRRFKLTLRAVDGLPFALYGAVTIQMDVESD